MLNDMSEPEDGQIIRGIYENSKSVRITKKIKVTGYKGIVLVLLINLL